MNSQLKQSIMKAFKGTQGEWVAERDTVIFDTGAFQDKNCDLYSHHYENDEEMIANAKLIAAAPDLLKALIHVSQMMLDHLGFQSEIAQEAINKALVYDITNPRQINTL